MKMKKILSLVLVAAFAAVSYTHLDVYKRQELGIIIHGFYK